MSVAAVQSSTPARPRPPAPAASPAASMAAELIARSSVAGITLMLLASAAPPAPSQGQQVDARA